MQRQAQVLRSQEFLSTTRHERDGGLIVEVKDLFLELTTLARSTFAIRDDSLLLAEGQGVESNSPLHASIHDLPQMVTRSLESLFKVLIDSDLRLRNPDRLLHSPIDRHVDDSGEFRFHWGSTGVPAFPANPLSHLADRVNGLEGEPNPTVKATGESLRIDGFARGALPPTNPRDQCSQALPVRQEGNRHFCHC